MLVVVELLQADSILNTHRQEKANGHISKLCKRAYNVLYYLVLVITLISRISSN
jgi:hypothetical protein